MKRTAIIYFFSLLVFSCACTKKTVGSNNNDTTITPLPSTSNIAQWLTTPDQSSLLQLQITPLNFSNAANGSPVINIDSTQTFQTIDGFGFCFTGGSASLINQLSPVTKNALLHELFSNDSSCIGISYIRISIGASDLSNSVFSYDDLPVGQTDTAMQNFSLAADTTDLIPILKQIIAINPAIKILGSPWSPPLWMKTNHSSIGGSLLPQYYTAYAKYFVKYILAMKAEGITIDAVTPQNEPLNPDNNPSLEMQSTEEDAFIKTALGPAFQAAGIPTKIIVWDHNCDNPGYPESILSDAMAAQYVDGSGFHLYAGNVTALSTLHNAYPNKNVYFTEFWLGGPSNFPVDFAWHMQNIIIGTMLNWSRNALEWNLASDPNYNPHTNGGCSTCLGALTISANTVSRNTSYYIIAHASKFVPAGSVRIASNAIANLPNVAFITPARKKVLIVFNNSNASQSFNIQFNGKQALTSLPAEAASTYVW